MSHGRENHVHKSLNEAVHSYDYKKGPGLHESHVSCGAVNNITTQPYIFFRNMLKNSILPSKAQIIRKPQVMNYEI